MDILLEQLFATDALALANEDEPFWYTSGKLGPFYINTHYLAGGQARAEALLQIIETALSDPTHFVPRLFGEFLQELETNKPFYELMMTAKKQLETVSFDIISGGERRDFFFSLPLAYLLGKPHLSILKDGRSFYTPDVQSGTPAIASPDLRGKQVLHVADIVTKASSFTRLWVPAIHQTGATIHQAFAMLDRHQGGRESLSELGICLMTLGDIDERFFAQVEQMGRIDPSHRKQVQAFLRDPDGFMTDFLLAHPNFITEQLAQGGKAAERAQLALDAGFAESPTMK